MMIHAIQHLKMAAEDYRRMSTPNANTITEYTANKNAELALEFEVAAEALRKLHNEGFNEGVLAGLKSLAESCKARREKKADAPDEAGLMHDNCHMDIDNARAAHSSKVPNA